MINKTRNQFYATFIPSFFSIAIGVASFANIASAKPGSQSAPNVICDGSCGNMVIPKRLIGEPSQIPAFDPNKKESIAISFEPAYIKIGNVKIKKSAIKSLSTLNLSDYRLRAHGIPVNTRVLYVLYFVDNKSQLSAISFEVLSVSHYYQLNDTLSDWYPTLQKSEISPRIRDCGEVLINQNGGSSYSVPPRPGACGSDLGIPSTLELNAIDNMRRALQ